ncbi:MAG: hotdog fold thioesterase [Cyclobacteriaceae bacterium]
MIRTDITVDILNEKYAINLCGHLGIEYTEVTKEYLCAKMPVDNRTKQPYGILHGGASVVLAESVGSMAANLCVDNEKKFCVGQEINANHIKSMTEGFVYCKASPVHLGKNSHVWSMEITNDKGELVCISRLTVAVLDKRK